ncbi:aminopeptidase N-like [Malaya genurostris]|uniref:aminopeptidase N-like n=1 Tax=Malaya genurostris TaxID=325434 RepID=UPI0026F3AC2B|nr:aminopeptidase N-like [Malaya genurostris]
MSKIVVIFALIVSVCNASPFGPQVREFTSYRLPNTTIPTHYELYLDTNVHIGEFKYIGNLKISISILENTKQIVLHSVRNVIDRLEIHNSNHLSVPIENFEFDDDKEFLIINCKEILHAGTKYFLYIDFTNSLDRDDRAGFYRSYYENDDEEIKHLALTQFEPSDARSAFPCYDEPGIKTTFNIKISCGIDYHAKSNSPALGISILPGDKKVTTFQTTPRMQTYLVAFLVSDFVIERRVVHQPRQVAVSTLARPTAKHLLTYSVDSSVKFLHELETYFNHSYAMSKIDNVAVDNDHFWAGAMENWGLVTYRESTILFDPETDGEDMQLNVVGIVGHEYTHQFFGNLLAPKWWSYLWLNEGFARLYQYYVSEFSHPEFNMRERFGWVREYALEVDADPAVRPMTYYAETGIRWLFDSIAYQKSASVLRMLNYAVSESTFKKGLRYYIQHNENDGVVTELDLFDSLEQAVKEDDKLPRGMTMHEVFASWSNQPGAPLVTVGRDGDTNVFVFNQERFYYEPQEMPGKESWWIPISYFTPSSDGKYNSSAAFWMAPNKSNVTYEIELQEGDFVLINPLARGYYRVNYDPQTWADIIYNLYANTNAIDNLSKSQLIDDSMNLAHAGKLDYDTAFNIFSYLQYETEYVPWATAASTLKFLHRMLRDDEQSLEHLENYAAHLAVNLLTVHGINSVKGESANIIESRLIALEWACKIDSRCQAESRARFDTLKKSSSLSLRSKTERQIICHQIQEIDVNDFTTVVENLISTRDKNIRSHVIEALACIKNEHVILQYLDSIKSKSFKESEKLQAVQAIYQKSSKGLNAVLEFIDKSPDFLDEIKLNQHELFTVLKNMAEYTVETGAVAKLTKFVQRVAPSLLPTIEAKLQYNRRWVQRNAAIVSSFLKSPPRVDLR